jgi:hypothetical protein
VTSTIGAPLEVARKIDARLADVARTSGYAVIAPKITTEEASCGDAECMRTLAEARGAEVIVRADLFFAPSSSGDVVQVALFRRSVPRSMRTEEQPCPTCDDQRAVGRAGDLGLRLLRSDAGTGAPPLEPVNLLRPAFEEGRATAGPSRRQSVLRALGFTSVALTAGALGLAIGMGAADNGCSQTAAGTCLQRVDTTGGIVAGVVLTVGFAVTSAVLLARGYKVSRSALR